MDVTSALDAPCAPEQLFDWIDNLALYPSWLEIVKRAVATEGADGDAGPAWAVDLRARLGPLARSKRLRMVRTTCDAPSFVRFERAELDGRSHSPWILEGSVEETNDGSRLTMRLHYGGTRFGLPLERLLRDEIARSRPRLLALIAGG